jgi:hypothetical protein
LRTSTLIDAWWLVTAALGVIAGVLAVSDRVTRRRPYYGLVGVAIAAIGILASFGFSDAHPLAGAGNDEWSARADVLLSAVLGGALSTLAFAVSGWFWSRLLASRGR